MVAFSLIDDLEVDDESETDPDIHACDQYIELVTDLYYEVKETVTGESGFTIAFWLKRIFSRTRTETTEVLPLLQAFYFFLQNPKVILVLQDLWLKYPQFDGDAKGDRFDYLVKFMLKFISEDDLGLKTLDAFRLYVERGFQNKIEISILEQLELADAANYGGNDEFTEF